MKKRWALFLAVWILAGSTNSYALDWHALHYYFVNFNHYKNGEVINAEKTPEFSVSDIPARTDALRFLAFGCFGTGNGGQKIISNEMAEFTAKRGLDFSLLLGDNFYPFGVKSVNDEQWQEKFEQMYPADKFPAPFYAILGNHDYHRNAEAQIEYSQKETRWSMPAHYYTFSKTLKSGTQADFFGLDATILMKAYKEDSQYWRRLIFMGDESAHVRDAKKQLVWLREKLKSSGAKWKIVYAHAPLFSGDAKRGKEVEALRSVLLPILTEFKVDLYLSAHAHTLELMKPVGSVHFVVSGAASRPRKKLYWTQDTIYASADLSYVWLQLSESDMDIAMMGENQKLKYFYQISKP